MPDSTFHRIRCPAGFYCEANAFIPVPCPAGTYGGAAGLATSGVCTPCPAGSYCSEAGLLSVSGLCEAGYWCKGSAITPRPTSGPTGEICTAGGYCELGTKIVKSCQSGTYNPSIGKKYISDCLKCLPGHYCQGDLSSKPTGKCTAGWYCTQGALPTDKGSSVPDQYPAQPGTYTISVATTTYPTDDPVYVLHTPAIEIPCPVGTYTDKWHSATCFPCYQGFYCPYQKMSTNIIPCPAGAYCPSVYPLGL